MSDHDTSRISPTAHYTGYVWCKNGLSPAALATATGRVMFWAMQGPMRIAAVSTGGLTLEKMLLQRHLIIDHLLDEAIGAGEIGQVVEIAAGLSGRGLRMMARHERRDLLYVESDLPGMLARKRRMLASVGSKPGHHLVAVNALEGSGRESLEAAVGPLLDKGRGTAIVTEGLLSYFSETDVRAMFARFASFLGGYSSGLYLSDVHSAQRNMAVPAVRAFRRILQVATRGQVQLHFEGEPEVRAALEHAGFSRVSLHRPRDHAAVLDLPPPHDDFVTVLKAQLR